MNEVCKKCFEKQNACSVEIEKHYRGTGRFQHIWDFFLSHANMRDFEKDRGKCAVNFLFYFLIVFTVCTKESDENEYSKSSVMHGQLKWLQ